MVEDLSAQEEPWILQLTPLRPTSLWVNQSASFLGPLAQCQVESGLQNGFFIINSEFSISNFNNFWKLNLYSSISSLLLCYFHLRLVFALNLWLGGIIAVFFKTFLLTYLCTFLYSLLNNNLLFTHTDTYTHLIWSSKLEALGGFLFDYFKNKGAVSFVCGEGLEALFTLKVITSWFKLLHQ